MTLYKCKRCGKERHNDDNLVMLTCQGCQVEMEAIE